MTTGDYVRPDHKGHVVVVGLHGIGLRIVEQLIAIGQQVVVIDNDADDRSVRQIEAWGVGHVVGNAARAEILLLAGLANARSIICLESSELHTLEVALLARDVNPGVRVIVRSSNESVGKAISDITGPGTVLDAEALAAPAFVEAVLQQRVHDFDLAGERFRLVETVADASGSYRDLYGDLVPVAIGSDDDAQAATFPARDQQVAAGARVALLGSAEQLARHGVGLRVDPASAPHPVGARYGRTSTAASHGSLRALWQTIFYGADRALKTTFVLLVLVTVISTVVIDLWYVNRSGQAQMDAVDAIYTTVQTLVTVGYGDFPFGDQPTFLRVFDIVLMLVGAALIAVMFAQLTDLLVSRRVAASFGSQRAGSMRNHVVVVGLGGVGMRVVEQLRAQGRRVAVIDKQPSPANVSRARNLAVPVVVADATSREALTSANLRSAAGVAVLTSNDLANIETGLAIRTELDGLRDEVPTVLRLFDRHLSDTVQRAFGFREVRSTAALASPWFVAASLGLNVNSSVSVAGVTMMVGNLEVAAGSRLAAVPLRDLGVQVRVVAIQRAGTNHLEHPLRRSSLLQVGDRVFVIGPHSAVLDTLVRNIA